jgi:hypothetical protein
MSEKKDAAYQPSTSSDAAQQQQPQPEQQNSLARLMGRMLLDKQQRKEAKETYAFWETQPVVQFSEDARSSVSAEWPAAR